MSRNEHYLQLLKIPVWKSRTGCVEEEEAVVGELVDVPQQAIEPLLPHTHSPSNESPLMESSDYPLEECRACQLHQHRTQVVKGRGTHDAKLLIVTEAPTFNEDIIGESLVEDANALLNNVLKAIRYDIQDVYITPYIKCFPFQTFITQTEEELCFKHLLSEIETIKPHKILLLGRNVSKFLLKTNQPFDDLRQKIWHLDYLSEEIPVYVSYNFYQLLKFPDEKGKLWKDLKQFIE